MFKNLYLKLSFVGLCLFALGACSDDDDEAGLVGAPECSLNSDTGEYKVKIGHEVTLQVTAENAINPVYAWKRAGKIVSEQETYQFKGDQLGEFFVNFRLDADNGSVEKQAKITVVDRLPPEITVSSSAVGYCDVALKVAAETKYTDESTTFEWSYGGRVVSHDSIYQFKEKEIDVYTLALKVTNADGVDVKNINISVIPEEEPVLFFDNGRYVEPSTIHDVRTMTCPIGRSLVLAPVRFSISDDAVYEWSVDGSVQSETSIHFKFTPSAEGQTYEIKVKAIDGGKTAEATVKVVCTPQEGTYFRAPTAKSYWISNHCFEFTPAPGQFVNFSQDKTAEDA